MAAPMCLGFCTKFAAIQLSAIFWTVLVLENPARTSSSLGGPKYFRILHTSFSICCVFAFALYCISFRAYLTNSINWIFYVRTYITSHSASKMAIKMKNKTLRWLLKTVNWA